MEGLGVFLVVIYLIVSFFGRAVKAGRTRPGGGSLERAREAARERARAAARERAERLARAGAARRPAADHGGSPTQVEGRALEELLRGLGDVLGMPEDPVPARVPWPGADAEQEEAYSLEGESLEGAERGAPVPRPERPAVSADQDIEALVLRRVAAAEARSGALGPKDHEAFHQKLARREESVAQPAAPAPAPRYSASELRRAVVWREILGPPVALRSNDPD